MKPHPLGVRPLGQSFFSSVKNCRDAGLGALHAIPDEVLLQVFEELDAKSLLALVCCLGSRRHKTPPFAAIVGTNRSGTSEPPCPPCPTGTSSLHRSAHLPQARCSKALMCFAYFEENWKRLVLETYGGRFRFAGSWRDTFRRAGELTATLTVVHGNAGRIRTVSFPFRAMTVVTAALPQGVHSTQVQAHEAHSAGQVRSRRAKVQIKWFPNS